MRIKVIAPLPFDEDYPTLHARAIAGIDDEIKAVVDHLRSWGGDQPVRAFHGDFLGVEGDAFVYSFYLPRAIFPPEFTAVEVSSGGGRVRGFVEEVEGQGRVLVVSLSEDLPGSPTDAEITFDPTQILRSVKGRLLELAPDRGHKNLQTVLRALGFVEAEIGDVDLTHPCVETRGMNAGQKVAASRAVGSELALIFGPPGTGKTSCTLGPIVAELAEMRDKRVLVTAHTNTALDVAMEAVVQCAPNLVDTGMVIRFGKIRRRYAHLGIGIKDAVFKQSRSQEAIFEPRVAELEKQLKRLLSQDREHSHGRLGVRRGDKLSDRIEMLLLRARMLQRRGRIDKTVADELASIEMRATEIRSEIERKGSDVLKSARVVGATLSSVALNYNDLGDFDVVVIDEGSMASLPQVIVAASKARSQVIILGDPQQTPPVVVSDTPMATKYLGRNPYMQLGLEDPAIDDVRRPMLTTQYRMAPPIRKIVSDLFYAGKLEDGKNVHEYTGDNALLIDTSNTDARAAKKGGSRINLVHSQIVVDVVRECFGMGLRDIGVITPFNAQSKIIRQSLDAAIPGFFRGGNFVGTVHRSQGGEKDVIILDFVDTLDNMSSFLDESWNPHVRNLLCVALSRARKKLIVIAHTRGFRAKYGYRRALIMRILGAIYHAGEYRVLETNTLQVGAA